MICRQCRDREHGSCPELARQRGGLSRTERLGSQLCECQHLGWRESWSAFSATVPGIIPEYEEEEGSQ